MGNIDAKRDWGHAKDYVYMQWLMLQQQKPEDFVIATGRMETVRRFIEITADKLGWFNSEEGKSIIWQGEGIEEIGLRADTKEVVIRIDQKYFRPAEVDQLLGDPSKAFKKLNWVPKTTLEELIEEMVVEDRNQALDEIHLTKNKSNY